MKASSILRAWTSSTSTSPISPIFIALPEPTAITLTVTPDFCSKRGSRYFNRPEFSVLVVVASFSSPACAADIMTRQATAVARRRWRNGLEVWRGCMVGSFSLCFNGHNCLSL
ncbi:hypothetical protein D9M70_531630 [compost metagenome]